MATETLQSAHAVVTSRVAGQSAREYVIITGHGRSGTNWLLGLLNLSPRTHCRNSPYLDPRSPLSKLPSRFVCRDDVPELQSNWDHAIDWTASHLGAGDQRIPVVKDHLYGLSYRLGLSNGLYYGKVRRALALVSPALRRMEWPVPFWLGKNGALQSALPVLRTSQVPGWVCWALRHRPAARVLHIVRHPGGFLNSWRNRFLRDRDTTAVHVANLARLTDVAEADTAWAAKMGQIDRLSLEASELWYWRYATEKIHAAGSDSGRYERVIYEKLAADPIDAMRRVYGFCELEVSDAMRRLIRNGARQSQQIADAWRDRLNRTDRALIDEILRDSPMRGWWDASDDAPRSR